MTKPQLAVIMPVYNEEKAIRHVIIQWTNELRRLQIPFEIHAYNDGSKDNTLNILNSLAKEDKALIVHDKQNSGHGPTILQAYRQNSHIEWIFQTDSDDEIGPEYFQQLWKQREQYDFLIGQRVGRNSPLSRRFVSYVSRIIVRSCYGRKICDVNSPYRLMRCARFENLFTSIPEFTFAPNVIISGMACLNGYRILEMPVQYKFRTSGEVSIKKWNLFKAAVKSFVQTVNFRFKAIL